MRRVFSEVSPTWQGETWDPLGTLVVVQPIAPCSCSFPGFAESCSMHLLPSIQPLCRFLELLLFLYSTFLNLELRICTNYTAPLPLVPCSMNSSCLSGPEF